MTILRQKALLLHPMAICISQMKANMARQPFRYSNTRASINKQAIMKRTILIFYSILLTTHAFSQQDTLNQRIFLLGDAGELRGNSHPVIDWLSKHVDWNDEK